VTGDIIVMIDADGSTDGAEIIRFVGALATGADYAKGSRFSSSGGSDDITGLRRYGNRVLSRLVNWMFGTHFTDLCYGYNAFWARHLDAIEVSDCPGFEVEALMNIRAARAGLIIHEVPSHESPRIFGASNLHTVRDGWRILKVIVRERLGGPREGARRPAAPVHAVAPVPSAVQAHRAAKPAAATSGVPPGAAAGRYRMPGHDHGTSVPDRDIVTAIAERDAGGAAAAFGRYAQELHAYCRSRLTEPADAAEAVRDTFVIAAARLPRLSRPDRMRAWLFAVARNQCQWRLRAAVPSARLYEAAQAMDDTGTFAVFTEPAEFRAQVRAALAGMDPVDREISELNLRHGFYGADLGEILGVPRNRVHALAARARSRFEKSLGVLLVARSQREHCPELAGILDGHGGQSSVSLRWRVRRHSGRCAACRERKRGGLNPAILLSLLPVIPMPGDLRQRTLALVADKSPDAVAHRARVMNRAGQFGTDGFPVQLDPPPVMGRRITYLSAAVAAAAALALLGGGMYYAGHPAGQAAPATAAVNRRPPVSGRAGPDRFARVSASARVPASVRSAAGPVRWAAPSPLLKGAGAMPPGSSALTSSAARSPGSLVPTASPAHSPVPAASPAYSPRPATSPRPSSSPQPSPPSPSSVPASSGTSSSGTSSSPGSAS
jgi:RNA polymerase sigma factor (sigma-70 family)